MKKINTYLADRQIDGLDELATKTGIKSSEHIRRAIDAYLAEQAGLLKTEHYSLGNPKPKSEGNDNGTTENRSNR
jgi:metal-responsive CopG/Arc/MetJ family transcriptional regulator